MYKLDSSSAKPPYLQVKQMLRERISSGEIEAGASLPKELVLAKRLRLSRMTVRRAIVELAEEGLVRRVRGQGTFVEPGARACARRASAAEACLRSVAVVSPTGIAGIQHSLFYHRLLQGIQDATAAQSASLALRPARAPASSFVAGLSDEGADGVVAFGLTDRALIGALASGSLPTVFVDCASLPKNKDVGIVRAECESTAHQAATHLLNMGHRDIGILAFSEESDVVAPRRIGFERALRDAGRPAKRRRVYPTVIAVEGGYATMRRIITSGDVPTALVCCADEMALGVIAAAQEHGMRIPSDLSVVGFGDVGYFSAPPRSSVRIPIERMGAAAVELLAGRVADPRSSFENVTLPSEWLLRSTCDVPRARKSVGGRAK